MWSTSEVCSQSPCLPPWDLCLYLSWVSLPPSRCFGCGCLFSRRFSLPSSHSFSLMCMLSLSLSLLLWACSSSAFYGNSVGFALPPVCWCRPVSFSSPSWSRRGLVAVKWLVLSHGILIMFCCKVVMSSVCEFWYLVAAFSASVMKTSAVFIEYGLDIAPLYVV